MHNLHKILHKGQTLMRVLVACEFSNTVRDAFLARGHDAYSCDLQRADHPNPHYKRHVRGDVRPLLRERWDLVIAHPPCTYLANVGVWMLTHPNHPTRWASMEDSLVFFKECLAANAPRVCVENPTMHSYARDKLGIEYTQVIQPYYFGDPFKKRTLLWLKGLLPLEPTDIVEPIANWIDREGSSLSNRSRRISKANNTTVKNRTNDHSRTFQGIANAMASQWG